MINPDKLYLDPDLQFGIVRLYWEIAVLLGSTGLDPVERLIVTRVDLAHLDPTTHNRVATSSIARDTDLSPSTARRRISALCDSGWLTVSAGEVGLADPARIASLRKSIRHLLLTRAGPLIDEIRKTAPAIKAPALPSDCPDRAASEAMFDVSIEMGRRSGFTPLDRAILLVIASQRYNPKAKAGPGVRAVARVLDRAPATIHRRIHKLIASGHVQAREDGLDVNQATIGQLYRAMVEIFLARIAPVIDGLRTASRQP